MATDIEFDERIKAYEQRAHMVDGKGHAVNREDGTRVYREVGPEVSFHHWMEDVQTSFGGELIPFEWVCDYVGVSRAALHKRVNRGGITVLVFEMHETVRGVLGGHRDRMRREYKYVPKLECDSWRELLGEDAPETEK